jgi:hypothetical protein
MFYLGDNRLKLMEITFKVILMIYIKRKVKKCKIYELTSWNRIEACGIKN